MRKPEEQLPGTNKESLERRTQEKINLDDQKLSNKELEENYGPNDMRVSHELQNSWLRTTPDSQSSQRNIRDY